MILAIKETHRQRKQIYGYQRRKGRSDKLGIQDWQVQITVYKINK